MKRSIFLAFTLLVSSPIEARTLTVQMLNHGKEGFMVFEPSAIQASVGDTIQFVPTDPGHDVEPIDGMLPAGVALPTGKISQSYSVRVAKPGVYGFKCTPHFSMGMVAVVRVGDGRIDPSRIPAALPPLAAKKIASSLKSFARGKP